MSRFGGRLRGSQAVSTWLAGGAGAVKSVQTGLISITGATSNTATVASVDVNNAILLMHGQTYSVSSMDQSKAQARITLTNPTTVTATVNTSPAGETTVVAFTLVEFYPGAIRSVQRGTVTGAATATISSVINTKLVLTNATTVTHSGTAAASVTSGYQVVEWR
jgi:hypothetical protein